MDIPKAVISAAGLAVCSISAALFAVELFDSIVPDKGEGVWDNVVSEDAERNTPDGNQEEVHEKEHVQNGTGSA